MRARKQCLAAAAQDEADYDHNGNRTGYTVGDANRVTSDGTFSYQYDDEGNLTIKTDLTTDETWAYTYDHRNRLIRWL